MARALIGRRVWRGDRGQILPLAAVALIVLFGAAAMAVDMGYLRYKQRIQQTAADSAAIAAAIQETYPNPSSSSSPAPYVAAALQDAATNGFANGGNISVQVNKPPSTGAYTTDPTAVEVIVTAQHPSFFERALGVTNRSVAARAVAILRPGGDNCVIALQQGGLSLNQSTINAPHCGFFSNGALSMNGAQSSFNGGSYGAAGRISDQSGNFVGGATPAPAAPTIDPCLTIPGCAYLATNPPATTSCIPDPGTSTLYAGVYCSLNLSNRSVFFADPGGLYVTTNGFSGNSSTTLTSNSGGVTFYIAGGKVDANNISSWNLSAPTSGNTAGVLFYQPPSNTNNAVLNAGSGTLSGILYFPTVNLNTNASFAGYTEVIVGSANMNAATITSSATSTPPGVRHAVLAE